MGSILTKIVGSKFSDFNNYVSENKDMKLHEARLITTYKAGDEMALTAIFLSALKLIKEFRKDFFSDVSLPGSGKIHIYTEVSFPKFENSRIDGLILVVGGNLIKDAAIFEVKNKGNELQVEQLEKYLQIAKQLRIPKLITISNQFVSMPTQSPVPIKSPKGIDIYHFSWSYILTMAHILLYTNDKNIEDKDQIEIMKEVVAYFENPVSGVFGFTQMKAGWKELVGRINAGTRLKLNDNYVSDTVSSWQQEERDMALILSRKLGVLVQSGESKYRNNLKSRIDNDSKTLINEKQLTSILKVKGAVSDILIRALFEKRIVEMIVKLNVPLDKGIRGQIGWLNKQIKLCKTKEPKIFETIEDELKIGINIKRAKGCERVALPKLRDIYKEIKDKEIKEFNVVQVKDFGKSFSSRKKFVEEIEAMLVNFYKGIIQHLHNWEQPAPPLSDKNNK